MPNNKEEPAAPNLQGHSSLTNTKKITTHWDSLCAAKANCT